MEGGPWWARLCLRRGIGGIGGSPGGRGRWRGIGGGPADAMGLREAGGCRGAASTRRRPGGPGRTGSCPGAPEIGAEHGDTSAASGLGARAGLGRPAVVIARRRLRRDRAGLGMAPVQSNLGSPTIRSAPRLPPRHGCPSVIRFCGLTCRVRRLQRPHRPGESKIFGLIAALHRQHAALFYENPGYILAQARLTAADPGVFIRKPGLRRDRLRPGW
ncbi:hypothetical protein SAMN05421543_105178 [Alicyclobacillus macrosporangiidus]|uniref:Uncharacterized protein n=1 Tax=Alicyclobacillus macrosporangiidus TaxID=392015 RepID=A0A1I7HYV5_9BACL|nr:hypothetical protein SAMN05421543_105178 [Alicyclobacillus macrosporangiidus]